MKRLLTAALALLALPALAAEPLPRATPASVGLSPERLARIGAVLNTDIANNRFSGAVVAIARRGKLAYYEAFGHLDGSRTRPTPRDAIYPIASMTKPLAGVATLMLMEDGKLRLNDTLEHFFPTLANRQVAIEGDPTRLEPARRSITVLDLMRHTSGLVGGAYGTTPVFQLYPPGSSAAARQYNATTLIERVRELPLVHQPGTVWAYGFSTDLLGLVAEQASGQSLGTFLQQRLFRPLGMPDTGFMVPDAARARYARPLERDPVGGAQQKVEIGIERLGFECGGACAVSTAGDYIRFAQMLLNNGTLDGRRYLSRLTVREMTRDHMQGLRFPLTERRPYTGDWGFGLTVAVKRSAGAGMLGQAGAWGWDGAYGTAMWVDPVEQLAVVFMASIPGRDRVHYRETINALVYQAIAD